MLLYSIFVFCLVVDFMSALYFLERMNTVFADMSLEDDEGNGEGKGWEIDQDQDLVEENLDLCLVGCFHTTTTVNF